MLCVRVSKEEEEENYKKMMNKRCRKTFFQVLKRIWSQCQTILFKDVEGKQWRSEQDQLKVAKAQITVKNIRWDGGRNSEHLLHE